MSTEDSRVTPVYISSESESDLHSSALRSYHLDGILQQERKQLRSLKPRNKHPLSHGRESIYVLQHLGWLTSISREPKPLCLDKVNKSAACQVAKEKKKKGLFVFCMNKVHFNCCSTRLQVCKVWRILAMGAEGIQQAPKLYFCS